MRELQDSGAREYGLCEGYCVRAASVGLLVDDQCRQRGHPLGDGDADSEHDQHQCPAAAEAEQALTEAELVGTTGGAP